MFGSKLSSIFSFGYFGKAHGIEITYINSQFLS